MGLAIAGLLTVVASPTISMTFAGVALRGFGVSLGFPLAVIAASRLKGRSSADNLAILTQFTPYGFLIGPPIIGLVAEFANMRGGLAALILPLSLAFAFAHALKTRTINFDFTFLPRVQRRPISQPFELADSKFPSSAPLALSFETSLRLA